MLLPVQQFKDFIKSQSLFVPQDKILLAVSGGKDSVVMAQLFAAAGFSFGIAHCNFNLRGEESNRDEQFVKNLASTLNVDFYAKLFDTGVYARAHKISIQMAARDLRYQFFEEIKSNFNYGRIAVAHHQSDAMETAILNLVRGTGVAGLHGIKAYRDGIIRPLMCFNSAMIEEMAIENDFQYVEDSSNESNKYMRNKIRLDIIPEMKKLNPSLEETFRKNIEYFADLDYFLNTEIESLRNRLFNHQDNHIEIKIEDIKSLNPNKFLLFELLKPFNFNSTTIENILANLDGISGKIFLSETHQILLDREILLLTTKQHEFIREQKIPKNQISIILNHGQIVLTELNQLPVDLRLDDSSIYVDAAALVYPLKLRGWQEGDRFFPFGMNGEKKISDYLISQKIPVSQKRNIPILINGDGKVIWVCGFRADDRFKVKSNTKKIIIFELKKN
jgi:tRNA(Ile)-lysidine synthase